MTGEDKKLIEVLAGIDDRLEKLYDLEKDGTRIGQLNGKWSILFRACIVVTAALLPFIIALQVWYVTSIFHISAMMQNFVEQRPLRDDALKTEITNSIHSYIGTIFQSEVKSNTERITAIEKRLIQLER